MHTFIFIHGAWHGAWCWEKLLPFMRKDASILTPDLPGHGSRAHERKQSTLSSYVRTISGILEQLPGKAILVGHSLGGIAISQAAEQMPEKVEQLVYVAAFLPANGDSLITIAERQKTEVLPFQLDVKKEENTISLLNENLAELFFHDANEEDQAWALERLAPTPFLPMVQPAKLTAENFGPIDKTYLVCTEDRALSPHAQKEMANEHGCRIFTLQSSHSPFLSQPKQLAETLNQYPGASND